MEAVQGLVGGGGGFEEGGREREDGCGQKWCRKQATEVELQPKAAPTPVAGLCVHPDRAEHVEHIRVEGRLEPVGPLPLWGTLP